MFSNQQWWKGIYTKSSKTLGQKNALKHFAKMNVLFVKLLSRSLFSNVYSFMVLTPTEIFHSWAFPWLAGKNRFDGGDNVCIEQVVWQPCTTVDMDQGSVRSSRGATRTSSPILPNILPHTGQDKIPLPLGKLGRFVHLTNGNRGAQRKYRVTSPQAGVAKVPASRTTNGLGLTTTAVVI